MTSLLVQTNQTDEQTAVKVPCLNIDDYDIEKLREVAVTGGVIYWDHLGHVLKVPNTVIRAALDESETYREWKKRDRPIQQPADIGLIWRDQALPTQSSESVWSNLPRLRRLPHTPPAESTESD